MPPYKNIHLSCQAPFSLLSIMKKAIDINIVICYIMFISKKHLVDEATVSLFDNLEIKMKYLTAEYVRAAAAKDKRIESVEWDEMGKALVWLEEGFTWCALDGNRSIEGFIIAEPNSDWSERDTVAYWKEQVANITPIVE